MNAFSSIFPSNQQTIIALATARGKSGVSILRISGPDSLELLFQLTKIKNPNPRVALLTSLIHPKKNYIIDKAIIVFFPKPHSFTGEDVVELHIHGSYFIQRTLLSICCEQPNIRLATAGEFTKRALYNGKIDLLQTEGLADLIQSETEEQHKPAFQQTSGSISKTYSEIRQKIVKVLAWLEAYIDFPDEPIPEAITNDITALVQDLTNQLENYLSESQYSERIRDGWKIALIGPPNAGKSSLLNKLANRDLAIVSPQAGTTRDVLEAHMDIAGFAVTICDTAGLRESEDLIEKEGIKRTLYTAETSDIICYITDITNININPITQDRTKDSVLLINKLDLLPETHTQPNANIPVLYISAKTGEGLNDFINWISNILQEKQVKCSGFVTRARHKQSLKSALTYLKEWDSNNPIEISSEQLRQAANHIGSITGHIGVEELLDNIFREFCIGK